MRIAEIYKSIQGEGFLSGQESVFIRASGCNLRCWFCDTPYASWQPEGDDLAVADIVVRRQELGGTHCVITGGEPLLFAELIPLCDRLSAEGQHITIETAGTLYLPVRCDLMSISPKLASSAPRTGVTGSWIERHERARLAPEVVSQLIDEHCYQLKFVVDTPGDCDEVEDFLTLVPNADRERVMLMPQGVTREELASPRCMARPRCASSAACTSAHVTTSSSSV